MAKQSWGRAAGRLVLELAVVFFGVYAAFLLNSYREGQAVAQEKHKVLQGLKSEFGRISDYLPQAADYQLYVADSMISLVEHDTIPFMVTNFRFIQPQYPLHLLDYALRLEGTDIIDQDLYIELSIVSAEAQKLQFVENKLTDLSLAYRPALVEGSLQNRANLQVATRFAYFLKDRGEIMQRLGARLPEVMTMLEERLEE